MSTDTEENSGVIVMLIPMNCAFIRESLKDVENKSSLELLKIALMMEGIDPNNTDKVGICMPVELPQLRYDNKEYLIKEFSKKTGFPFQPHEVARSEMSTFMFDDTYKDLMGGFDGFCAIDLRHPRYGASEGRCIWVGDKATKGPLLLGFINRDSQTIEALCCDHHTRTLLEFIESRQKIWSHLYDPDKPGDMSLKEIMEAMNNA